MNWIDHKLKELCKDTGLPKWRLVTYAMQLGIRHLYEAAADGRLQKLEDPSTAEELEDDRVQAVGALFRPTRYVNEE